MFAWRPGSLIDKIRRGVLRFETEQLAALREILVPGDVIVLAGAAIAG